MSLREAAAITGVGETAYTRGSGKSVLAMQLEAALKAIQDAGLSPKDIDGIDALWRGRRSPRTSSPISASPICASPPMTPMGGASCVAAIQCAAAAIAAGICNHVLLSIGRNGFSGNRIGARVAADAAVPHHRRVRDAARRHRAGAALRADGAPPHGALRHHQRGNGRRSRSARGTTRSSTATRR